MTFTIAGLVYFLLGFHIEIIVFLLLIGVFSILIVYLVVTSITLKHFKAVAVDENTNPHVVKAVTRVAYQFCIPPPHMSVVPSNEPNAFAGGREKYLCGGDTRSTEYFGR